MDNRNGGIGMSDETKAGIITAVFAAGLVTGGLIGGTIGVIIALTAVLMFVGTLYSSWLIERTEKRLARYIEHTGKAIEIEHRKQIRR